MSDNRTTVDSGALTMALNVLRRAGRTEVADALEATAIRGSESKPVQAEAPLTPEQIEKHTLLAGECPPGSKVILVSAIKRLGERA